MKSCATLCDPMDHSLPSSTVHETLQARTLEWVVISFSGGSSPPRVRIHVFLLLRRFFITDSPGRPIVAVTLPYTTFPIPLILPKASLYHIGTALEKERIKGSTTFTFPLIIRMYLFIYSDSFINSTNISSVSTTSQTLF